MEYIWSVVIRLCTAGAAASMFFPCVEATVGKEMYYSSMFTSGAGLFVIIALLVTTFFAIKRPHKLYSQLFALLTGGFGIISFFIKLSEFENKLFIRGIKPDKVFFEYGFYIGLISFGTIIVYSAIVMIDKIVKSGY